MIAQCDVKSPEEGAFAKSAGPFTVFTSKIIDTAHPQAPPSNMGQLFGELKGTKLYDHAPSLFHHYTHLIASNMMPFQDQRNPWQSFYPSMALSANVRGQNPLLYAILAQAAGNLAHLDHKREDMLVLATGYYVRAIEKLRESLEENATDFSIILASVLTLIMAEVYSGRSNAWKVHLNGAWNFLTMHQNERPWEKSGGAWVTAQSLCLLKIRSDTMEQPDPQASSSLQTKQSLIFSVASRDDFGFTVGASQGLIGCIYDITSLTSRRYYGDVGTRESDIDELHQRILACNLQLTPNKELVQLHHQIFKAGVLIHFHRRILNSTPRTLIPHLDNLLRDVTAYQNLEKGYVTLWPVFIGAVEAYQEEHKSWVRTWLDTTERIGAASRGYIRSLIEAVWRERKRKRDEIGEGAEEGDVIVDWRKVMGRMGMDVLLV